MGTVTTEPVVTQAAISLLAAVITWLVARYFPGVNLDAPHATELAGAVWAIVHLGLVPLVRALVTPTSKTTTTTGTGIITADTPTTTSSSAGRVHVQRVRPDRPPGGPARPPND